MGNGVRHCLTLFFVIVKMRIIQAQEEAPDHRGCRIALKYAAVCTLWLYPQARPVMGPVMDRMQDERVAAAAPLFDRDPPVVCAVLFSRLRASVRGRPE